MRRHWRLPAVFVVLATVVAGCGSQPAPQRPAPRPTTRAQPGAITHRGTPQCQVPLGQGRPGACAPRRLAARPKPGETPHGRPIFVDRSSNNAEHGYAYMAYLKRHGFAGAIIKANEGTGYVNPFLAGDVAAARKARLAVGVYDFYRDQPGESGLLVTLARQTGTCKGYGVIPPALDVEVGSPSRGSVQAALNNIGGACGRTEEYTGNWFAGPLFGCWWPHPVGPRHRPVKGWFSGYPSYITTPCFPSAATWGHQFTASGYAGASGDVSYFFGSARQWDAYVYAPRLHHRKHR